MVFRMVVVGCACVCAGISGWCIAAAWLQRRAASARRRIVRQRMGAQDSSVGRTGGLDEVVLNYVVGLSKRLSFGATHSLVPSRFLRERKENVLSKKGGEVGWLEKHAVKAGVADQVSPEGFREARLRLAGVGAAVGGLLGAVLSNELALLLGVAGLLAGVYLPRWVLRGAEKRRSAQVEKCLSEMLEVASLGLRSGLSFDRSFQLYGSYFTTPFAQACKAAQQSWSLGLTTRDEALRDLAASYDSEQLARVIEGIVRSLRFGSSLTESLEAAATEARAEHRARVEERVAKAPVKMMMPTGALILPAMLLLVLGPVLLELGGGF